MPTLPSGRRIEFSLDRFHAHLSQNGPAVAQKIVSNLEDPDDLLYVMDAVHFSLADDTPYFAGYVAADWRVYAADWIAADRQALQAWFISPDAQEARAEAIDYIKGLYGEGVSTLRAYPYLMVCERRRTGMASGSVLRQ